MRRSLVALATAALVGGTLAFAPAVTEQQAEPVTDHAIAFTEDGTQTVEGATQAGTNLLGGCSKDPDATCETIHVTVEQPVADEDPDAVEFGSGEVTVTLSPQVPGADFDFTVLESDATGEARGDEVATSGNPPACAQTCGPLGNVPFLVVTDCGGPDECAVFPVTSSDLDGTRYFVIEVYYFAAGGTYTLDATYTRTDGAGQTDDGGGDDGGTTDGAGAAADSAERVDVTGGFEEVGDWNNGQQAEVGDALGQDIEAAFIEYGDDTFTFTIKVTNLPAIGGVPEFTRYGWSFNYSGTEFELDGKFTNYSRGACDPTAGSCPPPRDPGIGFFALRGNCVTNEGNVTTCEELGGVNADFDPADGTITIPVPAEQLAPEGVQACDSITGATSFLGQSVWAAPTAFVTSSAFPHDQAMHFVPLVVPHADDELSC